MYDQSTLSELIRFARVDAGSTVIDVYPGDGDWTRLFSDVVGPEGRRSRDGDQDGSDQSGRTHGRLLWKPRPATLVTCNQTPRESLSVGVGSRPNLAVATQYGKVGSQQKSRCSRVCSTTLPAFALAAANPRVVEMLGGEAAAR